MDKATDFEKIANIKTTPSKGYGLNKRGFESR